MEYQGKNYFEEKQARRRDRSYKELIDAVKALRAHFGDSQQAFATRFGLSIRSIANYEKDRRPEDRVLALFAKAASDAGLRDLLNEFKHALGRSLGLYDIKGGIISYIHEEQKGYMLLQFEGAEQYIYSQAFFQAMAVLVSGTPDIEKQERVLKILKHLNSEVRKIFPFIKEKARRD